VPALESQRGQWLSQQPGQPTEVPGSAMTAFRFQLRRIDDTSVISGEPFSTTARR
jgi:hypothetical protein